MALWPVNALLGAVKISESFYSIVDLTPLAVHFILVALLLVNCQVTLLSAFPCDREPIAVLVIQCIYRRYLPAESG